MTLQNKTVLVTGAGGFLGSHLAERLVKEGARVRALIHYNARTSAGWLDHSSLADDMEIMAGDICDPASCETAASGCDIVYHLAALTSVPYSYRSPASFVRTNIDGTLCMLEAARRGRVERFVQASSSQTYGTARAIPIKEDHPLQAQSPYAATKIACDSLADAWRRTYGVPVSILKVFCTFGPRQSVRNVIPTIITQLLEGPSVKLGNLTPRRDYNYVDDAIDAYVSAATASDALGATLNICGQTEISIADLARLIARLMGCELNIERDDARVRPEGSEVDRLLGDPSLAQKLLGWKHKVGLEDGLEKTIAWYREHKSLVVPATKAGFI